MRRDPSHLLRHLLRRPSEHRHLRLDGLLLLLVVVVVVLAGLVRFARDGAALVVQLAYYAARARRIIGSRRTAAAVVDQLAKQDIIAGVPVSRLRPADPAAANLLLVAVTETVTPADIEAFTTALSKVLS